MIEGKTVVIRQLELGDEKLFHKWRNDASGNLYCGFKYGFLLSEEAFRLEIKKEIESNDLFPTEKTFIICKKEGLEPIGDISYRGWDYRNRSAEFGIEIGEVSERSKGYGCDALSVFIDYMFSFLNLNKVELQTLADNCNAQRLYEKLGFKEIGRIREKSFDSRTNSYIDVLYMDLLRSEWETKER
ncbi:MAG: N-acetyltransferase [Clostridia bacterium]|jgi:RimJ/RimL family protein N-acetyltransferase|nr:N-acetyltransferase [Clostridia bacterium]